jgi:hypothetical protein
MRESDPSCEDCGRTDASLRVFEFWDDARAVLCSAHAKEKKRQRHAEYHPWGHEDAVSSRDFCLEVPGVNICFIG